MKKVLFNLCAIIALLPCYLFSQQVTTLVPSGSGMDDALLLDSAGNLYAAGYDNGNIYRVTPGGTVTTFATGFASANGMAWDAEGNLVVCDNTGPGIYKIAPDSTVSLFLNVASSSGIIKDPLSDTLYFTSYLGHTIWKVAPDTTMIMVAQGNGLNGPVGLDWDDQNRLLIGNFTDSKVYRIDRAGNMDYIGQYPQGGALGFIAYKDGYIYGTRFTTHRVYRMDTNGVNEVVAGWLGGQIDGYGGQGGSARFNRPNGIVFSPGQDSLYITDYGAKSIRVISNLDSIGIVGLSEEEMAGFKMETFPNPAVDKLQVNFEVPISGNVSFHLLNLQGKEIWSHEGGEAQIGQGSITMDVSRYPSGTYFLMMRSEHLNLTRKVVLQAVRD